MRSYSHFAFRLFTMYFILTLISAATNEPYSGFATASAVTNLAVENFDDFVSAHAMVMVEFYAPWCAVCQELEPVYEKTASMVDGTKDIKFARVDCVADGALCDRYGTPIYPTLRLFQGTEQQEIYNGQRTPSDMISCAKRSYRPAVTILTKDDIEDFKAVDEVVVIGYWDFGDKLSNETFTKIAQSHRDYYIFGATNDPKAALAEGVSQPSLVLYKQYDNRRVPYGGAFQEDAISDFVVLESIPLVAEYDPKWRWRYFGEGTIPFAGVFANTVSERALLMDVVRPIAQEYHDILRFAAVDPTEFDKLTTKFDLQDRQSSAFVIRDMQGQIFPIPPHIELIEEVIRQWVGDFQNGKLLPYIKPELVSEASEVSEDAVALVVAENFDEFVLDSDSDVLVEFYAPWCGHCKRLVPVYAKLATLYAKHDQTVRIAKFDAAASKIPGQEVTSFPTIRLFPAGAKDAPLTYAGNRSLEDLVEFVRQNSRYKVDIVTLMRAGNGAFERIDTPDLATGMILDAVTGRQTGDLFSDEL